MTFRSCSPPLAACVDQRVGDDAGTDIATSPFFDASGVLDEVARRDHPEPAEEYLGG